MISLLIDMHLMSLSFNFIFADPPVLVRERSTTKTIYSSADSNEEIAMNCVFDGSPVPLVRFQKFGVEINSSSITYGPGSASYKLIARSEDDFGFYTCVATNAIGRASHFIEVYNRGTRTRFLYFENKNYFHLSLPLRPNSSKYIFVHFV